MQRYLVILAVVSLLLTGVPMAATATPLPLDGSWVTLDENMTAPAFFTGAWTFTGPAIFRITDIAIISDQFKVYDNDVLVFTTPSMPDWNVNYSSPYTVDIFDPATAWVTPDYSKASYAFGSGDHSITIQDIHIPPQSVGGPPFPDGTVAFSALPVPLPPTLLLFAPGLGLLGFWRRKRS